MKVEKSNLETVTYTIKDEFEAGNADYCHYVVSLRDGKVTEVKLPPHTVISNGLSACTLVKLKWLLEQLEADGYKLAYEENTKP